MVLCLQFFYTTQTVECLVLNSFKKIRRFYFLKVCVDIRLRLKFIYVLYVVLALQIVEPEARMSPSELDGLLLQMPFILERKRA